jgi:hypothetical protein
MKAECLVRTKEQDPTKLKQHQETVKNKTVAELGTISSFSDIPIPTFGKRTKSKERSR